jgi:hypothetical protein
MNRRLGVTPRIKVHDYPPALYARTSLRNLQNETECLFEAPEFQKNGAKNRC